MLRYAAAQESRMPNDAGASRPEVIGKDASGLRVRPHLADRDATCRSFRWADARSSLDGMAAGALNNTADFGADRPFRAAVYCFIHFR